jgi:septum formation protein
LLLKEKYKDYRIILATKSPRRQNLFKGLGLDFEIVVNKVKEDYPDNLKGEEIAEYLAELKANAFDFSAYPENTLIITADTIVCLDEHVLNKPKDAEDAKRMLRLLSGRMHKVITGICIKAKVKAEAKIKTRTFSVETDVYFRKLTEEELEYYVSNYKPFDKAGAYGAQEWIGYVAIEHISGSYFNVVGLPTNQLYNELLKF